MTVSALYEGTISHRRFSVKEHAFHHRVSMAYLDLDELPRLLGGRLVSARPGLARFRRTDHLGDPARTLSQTIREIVASEHGRAPEGPVRILTHLRTLGHHFNPVSFFYCHERDGSLGAVVAEVTSTPWGERHAYVLPRGDAQHRGRVRRVPQPLGVGLGHAAPAVDQVRPQLARADVHDRARGAGAEHEAAAVLDERELALADAAEQAEGDPARERGVHRATSGRRCTGTPLSLSTTACE